MTKDRDITRHAQRANRAAGARPEREFPPPAEPVKRTVPLALHPKAFARLVNLKVGDDPVLEGAAKAFNMLSRTLEDLHKREKAIRADGSKTAEAHALSIARLVDKNRDAPAGPLDGARKALLAEIQNINDGIAKSTRTAMDRADAQELRAILRGMTSKVRRDYFAGAIKDGNYAPLAAALAHPEAIASGMTGAERTKLQSDFERAAHPENLARRARLERAVEELDQGWQRYFNAANAMRDGKADAIAKAAQDAEEALNKPVSLDDEAA